MTNREKTELINTIAGTINITEKIKQCDARIAYLVEKIGALRPKAPAGKTINEGPRPPRPAPPPSPPAQDGALLEAEARIVARLHTWVDEVFVPLFLNP